MTELKIGYARVSTVDQDLTAQREALAALGVDPKRIYVDHGLTGTNRDRPGLREALAACRRGDTLVVTKLDRLARSVPDARNIVDELTAAGVKLNIGGSVHDPTDIKWCRFADCVSSGDPLTCDDVSCLSRCHQAFISNVCHFFGGPTQPGSGHCHEAHGPAMRRALLRHVMIGQSCVQGGRHLLPFHAEEESWKPAVEFSRVTDVGGRGSNPRPTDSQTTVLGD